MHGRMIDGIIRYYCTRYDHSRVCEPNAVGQDELLDVVLRAIEEQFTNPKVVARFRERLQKFLKQGNGKADAPKLKAMLLEVERKLHKAKQRLVEVDSDLLDVVQEKVRDLRSQRERISVMLDDAERPQSRLLAEHDHMFDRVIEALSNLRERIEHADNLHKRETIQQWFERIDVISEPEMWGKRKRYCLRRGILHLSTASFAELSPSSRRWSPRDRR